MANIGSIHATNDQESGEHIGRTEGRTLILFPHRSFSSRPRRPAALSLTFITSILTIARKGERRREIQGEKKQNTFCQIDVDHLSYLSAVAAAAEAEAALGKVAGDRREGMGKLLRKVSSRSPFPPQSWNI